MALVRSTAVCFLRRGRGPAQHGDGGAAVAGVERALHLPGEGLPDGGMEATEQGEQAAVRVAGQGAGADLMAEGIGDVVQVVDLPERVIGGRGEDLEEQRLVVCRQAQEGLLPLFGGDAEVAFQPGCGQPRRHLRQHEQSPGVPGVGLRQGGESGQTVERLPGADALDPALLFGGPALPLPHPVDERQAPADLGGGDPLHREKGAGGPAARFIERIDPVDEAEKIRGRHRLHIRQAGQGPAADIVDGIKPGDEPPAGGGSGVVDAAEAFKQRHVLVLDTSGRQLAQDGGGLGAGHAGQAAEGPEGPHLGVGQGLQQSFVFLPPVLVTAGESGEEGERLVVDGILDSGQAQKRR